MIRLWTPHRLNVKEAVVLDEKQHHYVFHVMRLKRSDQVLLFNGQDGEWICTFNELSKKTAVVMPIEQTRPQVLEEGDMLAVSLIKKDNLDLVLQKATELGVSTILLLDAARSVVHGFNMERAQLIVTEAAEQCERLSVPALIAPQSVAAFLKNLSPEIPLVYLSERGQTTGVLDVQKKICFVVGPEGGWTPEECRQFEQYPGSVSVNLGHLILRAETAAIGILAAHRFAGVFHP